jgi:hypothetical protein
VKRERRKLHKEELNDLHSSPVIFRVNKSRKMRWAGHVTRMGDRRVSYTVFVGKPEGRIQLGRNRRRWENNIKMEFSEVEGSMLDRYGFG